MTKKTKKVQPQWTVPTLVAHSLITTPLGWGSRYLLIKRKPSVTEAGVAVGVLAVAVAALAWKERRA